MTTGWILGCIMMVVFGLLGLIGTLMRISEQAKKDLLEKMLKNDLIVDKIQTMFNEAYSKQYEANLKEKRAIKLDEKEIESVNKN